MADDLQVAASGATGLTLVRSFAGPVGQVWRMAIKPAQITEWFCARTAPKLVCDRNFRVSGTADSLTETGAKRDVPAPSLTRPMPDQLSPRMPI